MVPSQLTSSRLLALALAGVLGLGDRPTNAQLG